MPLQPVTRNVLRAYRAASPEEMAEGQDWYLRAHQLATALDPDHVSRAAAVIAVLSPVTPWSRNQQLAQRAYDIAHRRRSRFLAGMPTMRTSAAKAWSILSAPEGADLDPLVTGPKVRRFWQAIMDPASPDAVVIDRHAVDVALGQVTDDDTRARIIGRVGGVETVARTYHRAASILSRDQARSVPVTEVQAVTWVWWRRHRAHHSAAHQRGVWG